MITGGAGILYQPRGAVLSACGRYRYNLWRKWDGRLPVIVWVLLNPSTADAQTDDATVRKCVGFAETRGYGGIVVVNLFAWRATDPRQLWRAEDPVGPDNDRHIAWAVRAPSATVVAGWGATEAGLVRRRAHAVRHVLATETRWPARCLGRTASGDPRHPCRLAYATPLVAL